MLQLKKTSLVSLLAVLTFSACNSTVNFRTYNASEVNTLTITKSDPKTGDHWFAELKRDGKFWNITSQSLVDTYADETYINHLLDSIRLTRTVRETSKSSPLFSLTWKTSSEQFQLDVGEKTKDGYYIFDGQNSYIARGSSFNLLTLLTSFETLRKRTWTNLSVDDVDEIEMRHEGEFAFYAQREGDQWTNKKHIPYKEDLNAFLEKMVSAQVVSFVDDNDQSKQNTRYILDAPTYQIRLIARGGETHSLFFRRQGKTLLGLNTTRPGATFVLKETFFSDIKTKPLWKCIPEGLL